MKNEHKPHNCNYLFMYHIDVAICVNITMLWSRELNLLYTTES